MKVTLRSLYVYEGGCNFRLFGFFSGKDPAARNIDQVINGEVDLLCIGFVKVIKYATVGDVIQFLNCGLAKYDLMTVKIKVIAFTPFEDFF